MIGWYKYKYWQKYCLVYETEIVHEHCIHVPPKNTQQKPSLLYGH